MTERAISVASKQSVNLVLFDFDKTIINRDTGEAYIWFMLKRSRIRSFFVLLVLPLVFPFLLFSKAKFIAFSILLWLLTTGMSERKQAGLRRQFIREYLDDGNTRIFSAATEALRKHCEKGDEIVIVSGASIWMVRKIVAATGMPVSLFLCSRERRFLSGRICRFHCYARNKVGEIERRFKLQNYAQIIGYSDSAADIPLLTLCDKRVLVNPSSRCQQKFNAAFCGNADVVSWQ